MAANGQATTDSIDFGKLADPVARALLGEPNKDLSKRGELRFGTNGSLKVVTEGKAAGTFSDFETSISGGLLDLIVSQRGGDHKSAIDWLRDHNFIEALAPPRRLEDRISAIYTYKDQNDAPLYEVVRLKDPKDFRQRRNENDWTVKGISQVPYRLSAILWSMQQGDQIFIVEGEKDADRLAGYAFAGTTNAGGAGKWKSELSAYFEGASIVIVPDNDEAGRAHVETVARSLKGIAGRIQVLELPDLPEKGDVSDWFDAGNTMETFAKLASTAPDWRPKVRLPLTFFGDEDRFPARKWLVKDLLGQNELSVIYAPSGGGKSFFALDLSARIAAGMEWFGHSITQSGVLYLCAEGASGFRNRMKAWRQTYNPGSIPFAMLPSSVNLLATDRSKEGLEAVTLIREAMEGVETVSGHPVRFIVLDTASRMMPGGVDSDPKDMKAFLDNVEELRRETGAHICIIHHSGKDKDRGMRGSSMLRDYADTVLEISTSEEGSTATIDKMKDGKDGTRYRFTLRQTTIGIDDDEEPITSCVIDDDGKSEGTEPVKTKRTPDDVENARRVLADLLCDEGVTGVTGCAGRSVTVDRWRDACRDKGVIEAGDAGRQQWKRLKDKALRLCVIGINGGYVWLA